MGGRGSGRKPTSILVICPKCGEPGRFYIWNGRLLVKHRDGGVHHVTRIVRRMVKERDVALPRPSSIDKLEYSLLRLIAYLNRKV